MSPYWEEAMSALPKIMADAAAKRIVVTNGTSKMAVERKKMAKARKPQVCIRCSCDITQETGVVRKVCSLCDLQLQLMHYGLEWKVFGKLTYMLPDETPSVVWFLENKDKDLREAISKHRPPTWRSWYKIPNNGNSRSKDNDNVRRQKADGTAAGSNSLPVREPQKDTGPVSAGL